MGCPYSSGVAFGILLNKDEYDKLSIETDAMEDWDEGEICEDDLKCDDNKTKFWIELSGLGGVDCCSIVREISAPVDIESAYALYDSSKILSKYVSRDRIKLLVTCEYRG